MPLFGLQVHPELILNSRLDFGSYFLRLFVLFFSYSVIFVLKSFSNSRDCGSQAQGSYC